MPRNEEGFETEQTYVLVPFMH